MIAEGSIENEVVMVSFNPNGNLGSWGQFQSTLSSSQQQSEEKAFADWQKFLGELTPEQTAMRQKFLKERAMGAPASLWQADQQAFLKTLTPQQLGDRNKALAEIKSFRQGLSPDQALLFKEAQYASEARIIQNQTPQNPNPNIQITA